MAQRDPLVEYQREGYDMFAAMLDSLKEESVGFLYNLQVQVVPAGEQPAAAPTAPVVTATSAAATALAAGAAAVGNGSSAPVGPTGSTAAPADGNGKPAQPRRRMRPVEALPTDQAALRAKGLGGPPAATPLTYSGPTEDGGTQTRRSGGGAAAGKSGAATATGNKPSRNAPCPCGSGKKYKLCHGRPGSE
jgi:preprotein translocase subunit SecA